MTNGRVVPSGPPAWKGIIISLGLAVIKGGTGLLAGSRTLIADAIFSATEACQGITQRTGIRVPPNDRRRMEKTKLLGIVISLIVLILLGALQSAAYSIRQLTSDHLAPPSIWAGVVAVLAITWRLTLFSYYVSRSNSSERSAFNQPGFDLFSSFIVMIGVIGAMTGQQFAIEALLYLDPAASILMSCLIVCKVYGIISDLLRRTELQDHELQDVTEFIETVQRVHGVIMVDDLRALERGHYINLEIKISVNPRIPVIEANEIANRAKNLLLNRFSHVTEVDIQFIPYDPGYPYKTNHVEMNRGEITTLLQ